MDTIAQTQHPQPAKDVSGAGARLERGRPAPACMKDVTSIEDLRQIAHSEGFLGHSSGTPTGDPIPSKRCE